ncbi:MAG: hypothetical protein MJ247_07745, partial [Alphaproteobacteria bacterium]|nr:hypothetical protein [Alphaproteobacteria bacterium]
MSFFTISPIFRQAPKLKLSKRIWIFIHYIWIVCTHKVKQLKTTEIVIDGKTYHCSNTKYCRKNHEFFYYKYEFDYVPVEQLWREYGNGRDFFCSPMYNYLKINNNDEFNHKERIL